jgi:hypothetical protein
MTWELRKWRKKERVVDYTYLILSRRLWISLLALRLVSIEEVFEG